MAKASFRQEAAAHLIAWVDGLLSTLDDHRVQYRCAVSGEMPGRPIDQDDVQVVVVPTTARRS